MKRTAIVLLVALSFSTGAVAEVRAAESDWEKSLEAAESALLKGDNEHIDENIEKAMMQAGDDDATRATIQNQLGVIRMNQHRYFDAHKVFHDALDLRLKTLGPGDPATLQTESNLALAEVKLGHEKEAEELYKKTIDGKRKVNPTAPSLAISLTNLANLYAQEKRCKEAKTLYTEALGIDSTEYGGAHKEVAQDLFNLGALLYQCNSYLEALGYLERARKTYEALNDDLGKAKALHYIALCYSDMHQHAKAADASLAALQTHEHFKGKGDNDTLVHLLNAADSVDAMGDSAKAQKLYRQALDSADAAKTPDNFKIAECNLEMGEFFFRHNDREKAEQFYKTAMVHYETLGKKERRNLYELPQAYVKLLQDAHRDEEADSLAARYVDVFMPSTESSQTPPTTPDSTAPATAPESTTPESAAPAATPESTAPAATPESTAPASPATTIPDTTPEPVPTPATDDNSGAMKQDAP